MLTDLLEMLRKDRENKQIIHVPKFFLGKEPGDICESDIQYRVLGRDETGTKIEVIDIGMPEDENENKVIPRIVPSPS